MSKQKINLGEHNIAEFKKLATLLQNTNSIKDITHNHINDCLNVGIFSILMLFGTKTKNELNYFDSLVQARAMLLEHFDILLANSLIERDLFFE